MAIVVGRLPRALAGGVAKIDKENTCTSQRFRDIERNLHHVFVGGPEYRRNDEPLLGSGIKEIILEFVRNLPDISLSEKDQYTEDIHSFSDETASSLYENLKRVIRNYSRQRWEDSLVDYIEKTVPPKYKDYKFSGGEKNAVAFLEQHWGKYMDHGVLYQNQLHSYDKTLIDAVYSHWRNHGRSDDHQEPYNRLPLPKRLRTEAVLEGAGAGPHTMTEIMRSARALDRRDRARTKRSSGDESGSRSI